MENCNVDLIQGLLVLTSIHLLAAASPGPDFILVSQQTLSHGRRSGFMCSLGIALGLSVHIIYSALGLAAIIANSTTALWFIKIIGGCYLLYLGYQGLRAKQIETDTRHKLEKERSAINTVIKGFFCNALNPKAPIYFVALFTLVLSPDLPVFHLMVYGIWLMVLQLLWFSAVVIMLSHPHINQKFLRFGHWIDRTLGGVMIIMGIKVITTKIN